MSEFPTNSFDCWRHHYIQDEPVDTGGLPFSDEFLDQAFPAVISQEVVANHLPDKLSLGQVSPVHVRSYQIRLGKLAHDGEFQQTALWQDNYGNKFTNLSLKGNNFSRQEIIESWTAPSGYMLYGLMEDDALLRVLRSSRLLREAGVDTEWPVRIVEPKQLMFGSERVSQLEYKKRLVEQVLADAEDFEEASKIARAVTNMSFFVVTRAMKIADRPADFLEDDTAEAVQKRLNRVFSIYNQTNQADSDYRILNPDSIDDRSYYAEQLLPKLLARNLAKLHNAGLAHCFPVLGNVSALGGLVDLDSVIGESLELDDAPVGFSEWRRDIQQLFEDGRSLNTVLLHLENLELLRAVKSTVRIFFDEYIASRGWDLQNNPKEVLQMGGAFSMRELGDDFYLQASQQLIGDLHPPAEALYEMRRVSKELGQHYFYVCVEGLIGCLDRKIREFGLNNLSQDEKEFSEQFDKFMPEAYDYADWVHSEEFIREFENKLAQLTQKGKLHEWVEAYRLDQETAPLVARACVTQKVSGNIFYKEGRHYTKHYNVTVSLAASRYFSRLYARLTTATPPEFAGLIASGSPQALFNGNFITISQRLPAEKLVEVALSAGIVVEIGSEIDENHLQPIGPADIGGTTYLPTCAFTDGEYERAYRDDKYELNITYLKLEDASYCAWLVGPMDNLRLYVTGPVELLATLGKKPPSQS